MIDEQVMAVALVLLVVTGALAVGVPYFANRTVEPFSELGILGPNQKIADYPKSVAVGENFTLYLYVGNHEGRVLYYDVIAKVGTTSSVVNDNVSLNAQPIATWSTILQNNQTYVQPITLHLNGPGTNERLVFELWVYQTNSSSFIYDHRFNQLFLNVTGS